MLKEATWMRFDWTLNSFNKHSSELERISSYEFNKRSSTNILRSRYCKTNRVLYIRSSSHQNKHQHLFNGSLLQWIPSISVQCLISLYALWWTPLINLNHDIHCCSKKYVQLLTVICRCCSQWTVKWPSKQITNSSLSEFIERFDWLETSSRRYSRPLRTCLIPSYFINTFYSMLLVCNNDSVKKIKHFFCIFLWRNKSSSFCLSCSIALFQLVHSMLYSLSS